MLKTCKSGCSKMLQTFNTVSDDFEVTYQLAGDYIDTPVTISYLGYYSEMFGVTESLSRKTKDTVKGWLGGTGLEARRL